MFYKINKDTTINLNQIQILKKMQDIYRIYFICDEQPLIITQEQGEKLEQKLGELDATDD